MVKMVYSCACCGSDVTSPYFFNGAVYGYTCIKKVNPSAKKVKDCGLWVSYQDLIIERPELDRNRFIISVVCNGKTFQIGVSYDKEDLKLAGIAEKAKLFKIATYANGSDPLFKSPVINTTTDKKGNPVVTSVYINGLPA